MANHALPRRGSAAVNALVALDGAGGTLTLDSWRTIIGWKGSRPQFDQNVVDRLQRAGLITLMNGQAGMSAAGCKFLGSEDVEIAEGPAQLAGPRYVSPIRALDLGRYRPPQVRRPGSMDYRNYPSVMGGRAYDYRNKAVDTDA